MTPAPIFRRNWHSSTTCGSQAACRISVTPRAAAAASSAVSVPVTDASSRYIDAPARPFGASRTWPSPSISRAPKALSAPRCIAIVRRAGKSPPGGASLRAAAPREHRAEQQHGAAQPADQRALRLVAHDLRAADAEGAGADAVDLGAEVGEQAGHHLDIADARHVGEHALLLGQQAGRQQRQRGVLVAADGDAARQRAARLRSAVSTRWHLPHALDRGSQSGCPANPEHLISSRAASTPNCRCTSSRHAIDRAAWMSAAVAPPSFTMKLACSGDTRAPPIAAPLSPARSTSAPADGRHPLGHRIPPGPDSGRCIRRSASAAAASACGRPATRAATSRSAAGVRRRRQREKHREHDLARVLQPAAVVGEGHLAAPAVLDPPLPPAQAHASRPARRSTARR